MLFRSRLPIYIDPGQAFGTGTHESTQLTLESMERWIDAKHVVFDLGTGSGILAIAASMLGATTVFGCDNDPVAVEVAAENTERNKVPRIGLMCGSIDSVRANTVSLLLCNVTADVITAIFPEIQRSLCSGAVSIFSGILAIQSEGIRKLTESYGHTVLEETTRGEWYSLTTRNGR